MPKCKNDPTRSFKGTEPSPKGLGYCAHGMKVGAVKKGNDGNKWEVREIKNGSKRWMKVKGSKKEVKSKKIKNTKNNKKSEKSESLFSKVFKMFKTENKYKYLHSFKKKINYKIDIVSGKFVEFKLNFIYNLDEIINNEPNEGYHKMSDKLLKKYFKSKYFIKEVNQIFKIYYNYFKFYDLQDKNININIPNGIILLKNKDIKNVEIKSDNISVSIKTKIEDNSKKHYNINNEEIKKKFKIKNLKGYKMNYIKNNSYDLTDMLFEYIFFLEHHYRSGDILNKKIPFYKWQYYDIRYNNYEYLDEIYKYK
jgi:hypothetical protein